MTLSTACQLLSLVQPQVHETLKEDNHVFAHAKDFDFWTGCCKFKDARIIIELS